MSEYRIQVHPLEFREAETDAVLDHLRGELGLSGLSLELATPALRLLRLRPSPPTLLQAAGGTWFDTDEERYSSTCCKPTRAGDARARRAVERLVRACHDTRFPLRAVISASRTARIARRFPQLACRNALGVESRRALCLANPDVRGWLKSLLGEVAERFVPEGIVLADFRVEWTEAKDAALTGAAPSTPESRALLSLCFCAACREYAGRSGVDVDEAHRTVSRRLMHLLQGGGTDTHGTGYAPPHATESPESADPSALESFRDWRDRFLDDLHVSLSGAVDMPLHRVLRGSNLAPTPATRGNRRDASSRFLLELDRASDDALSSAPELGREVLLAPTAVAALTPAELVSFYERSARIGVPVTISGYSTMSESCLEALRRGIRYARRAV
jgi:hypothetical protein